MQKFKSNLEKFDKVFWSYVAKAIIFVEVCLDFLLNQNQTYWADIRVVFIILNAIIMVYLLHLKDKEGKLEPQNDNSLEVSTTS